MLIGQSASEFAGVPFDRIHPYDPATAKRIVGALMRKLRADKRIVRSLNIDRKAYGRANIAERAVVWDYLKLRDFTYGEAFTSAPHLSAVFHQDRAAALLTFPHNMASKWQRQFVRVTFDHFKAGIAEVMAAYNDGFDGFKGFNGVQPLAKLIQRHYPTQSSPPIKDAELMVDLRTSDASGQRHGIKPQPEWLAAMHQVLTNKRANIQFQLGCEFDYAACLHLRQEDAHQLFVEAWLGARRYIDYLQETIAA